MSTTVDEDCIVCLVSRSSDEASAVEPDFIPTNVDRYLSGLVMAVVVPKALNEFRLP